jgi:predicted acylesterase/phospholipase RssA
VVSGSSAGSIMAVVVGTHTDTELRRILEDQVRGCIFF